MSDGHRLVQCMRQAGQTPQNEVVDIVLGTITAVNPLKVKIENRELTETFLIVGALCKETHLNDLAFTVPPHTHQVSDTVSKEATSVPTDLLLWRGLQVGDKVFMLKVSRGQKYYILQRVEGVIPT